MRLDSHLAAFFLKTTFLEDFFPNNIFFKYPNNQLKIGEFFLFLLQINNRRDDDVCHDDKPPAGEETGQTIECYRSSEDDDGERGKAIFHLIALETPLLELQGEKRHLANQQIAGDENQSQNDEYRP